MCCSRGVTQHCALWPWIGGSCRAWLGYDLNYSHAAAGGGGGAWKLMQLMSSATRVTAFSLDSSSVFVILYFSVVVSSVWML